MYAIGVPSALSLRCESASSGPRSTTSLTVCGIGARSKRLIERVRAIAPCCLYWYGAGRLPGARSLWRPRAYRALVPHVPLGKARIGPTGLSLPPTRPGRPGRGAGFRPVTIRVTKKRRAADKPRGRKPAATLRQPDPEHAKAPFFACGTAAGGSECREPQPLPGS